MQGVPDVMCMFHVIRNGDLPLVGNSAEYRDDPEKILILPILNAK